jgi:hypothetical protein
MSEGAEKASSPFGEKKDIDWKDTGDDFEGGEWDVEDVGKESPGVWDPDALRNSTGDLDPWNSMSKPPDRIQDLPLPSIADPPPQSSKNNSEEGEQWPFKDPCAFENSKKPKRQGSPARKSQKEAQNDLEEDDDIDEDVGESFNKLKIEADTGEESEPSERRKNMKDDGPSMPMRRPTRSDSEDDPDGEGQATGRKPRRLSKSRRAKDKDPPAENPAEDLFDRRSRSRSREGRRSKSKGSRTKGSDSAEKPKRRAIKKEAIGDEEQDDYDEEVTMELKLKGGDSDDDYVPQQKMVTPTSKRPGHRRRKSSSDSDPDAIQRRAQQSIANANAEMSRSAHGVRRHHSGDGLEGMGRPLSAGARNTRRARRQQDLLGSASYHETMDDQYNLTLSGRTDRSLDSIEDLEDFEHVDFQTPGIVMDYDEEIEELMHKNVPEHTAQLNRRVHRKRDQVEFDQNMPMMTRQALMTARASAMAMRGRVDVSTDERRRMMLDDSSHGKDAMNRSGHGRRGAPSRTRSSTIGMQAMARAGAVASEADEDNKRSLFRTRSGAGTNSFMKYMNKPNKLAQQPGSGGRRPPPRTASGAGDAIGRHSSRGPSASAAMERRGALQRAKSSGALTRPMPVRRDPRAVDKGAADDAPKPLTKSDVDSDEESSDSSGDSSVDSMAEDLTSPVNKKPPRKSGTDAPPAPPRSPAKKMKTPKAPKKKFDKRDFKVEKSRRKLHAVMYEAKMGVNMKDLMKKAKKDGKTGIQPKPLYVEA